MEENIFQAHARLYKKLIFMISCYDPEYAIKYITNLNNKTFNNYFKIFNLNDVTEINEIFEKSKEKQIIFITKLPIPELYSFNFIKDVYHIHLAIPVWDNNKDDYNTYISDIKKTPVQKFINVHDNKNLYNNKIEDKLFDIMVELIDRKVNNVPPKKDSEKFRRMPQHNSKIVLYNKRELNY
jgi:hypothetical protein